MHSRPPATGLSTADWRRFPPLLVPVHSVIPTQTTTPEMVAAKEGHLTDSHCGDPWPHVVVVDGLWLLEDGHHRWQFQVDRGERFFLTRVFVMDGGSIT